jgi:hypothetical protein
MPVAVVSIKSRPSRTVPIRVPYCIIWNAPSMLQPNQRRGRHAEGPLKVILFFPTLFLQASAETWGTNDFLQQLQTAFPWHTPATINATLITTFLSYRSVKLKTEKLIWRPKCLCSKQQRMWLNCSRQGPGTALSVEWLACSRQGPGTALSVGWLAHRLGRPRS